jgi:ADP-ribose pyrophosphatase YjhB (NUDIX family)
VGRFANAPLDRAAGGLVVDRVDGVDRIVVVHRSRYDDWTLPKGHLDAGETWVEAALREVREETGIVAAAEPAPLPIAYVLADGRPKVVVFFLMHPQRVGPLETPDEVDAVERWPLTRAAQELSHLVERRLVADLAEHRPAVDTVDRPGETG